MHVLRSSKRNPGVPDTIHDPKAEVVIMKPARLREHLVPSCITFRKGRTFSVRNMDRTQTRLARLGIFSAIDMQVSPADTTGASDLLNVDISCRFDVPMEASVEVNATSKSNSCHYSSMPLMSGRQATDRHQYSIVMNSALTPLWLSQGCWRRGLCRARRGS